MAGSCGQPSSHTGHTARHWRCVCRGTWCHTRRRCRARCNPCSRAVCNRSCRTPCRIPGCHNGSGVQRVARHRGRPKHPADWLHPSALAPSIDIESFSWISSRKRAISQAVETEWSSDSLPPGFRVVSMDKEEVPGQQEPLVHIMYSDGLANVSVFIEPLKNKNPARSSRVGSSNSFSVQSGDYQVTAVGEVPADTVQNIATSMRHN